MDRDVSRGRKPIGRPEGFHQARDRRIAGLEQQVAQWRELFGLARADAHGLRRSRAFRLGHVLLFPARVEAGGELLSRDAADIARAFEEAVADTLLIKCRRALGETGHRDLILAGGVSANQRLRERLDQRLDAQVHYPPAALCTDNGAMIAYAGWCRLAAGEREPLVVRTRARWPLTELSPPAGDQPNTP